MAEFIDNILRYGANIGDSIDFSLLRQYAQKKPFSKVDNDQLHSLIQLHIIGDDNLFKDSPGIYSARGAYTNKDCTRMLLLGASSGLIRKAIDGCGKSLEVLDIRFTSIRNLELFHVGQLRELNLQRNAELKYINGLEELWELQILGLDQTPIGTLLDISQMEELRELYLKEIEGLSCIVGLSQLERLKKISMTLIRVGRVLEIGNLTSLLELKLISTEYSRIQLDTSLPILQRLSISASGLVNVDFLRYLPGLEYLELRNCKVPVLPDLLHCNRLYHVDVVGTPVEMIGKLPQGVEWINLANTKIHSVPECIQDIHEIRYLNLSNLELEGLPVWLANLNISLTIDESNLEDGIILNGTNVKNVDLTTLPRQQALQHDWLEAQQPDVANAEQPLNEIKVVFLGDGEAGKSLLVWRLLHGGAMPDKDEFDGDATPGIAIDHQSMELKDRTVKVHFWDFGGQEILHAMHRIF